MGGGGGEGACGVFSVSKLFSLFCLIVNSAEDNDNFRPFPSHALLRKNFKAIFTESFAHDSY
jgi:hypothetical protein